MSMNYRYKLNAGMIRDHLEAGMRKQSFLVRELGISPSLVQMMMNQGHIPKERTLGKLANLLGVRTQDLLERHVEGAV